MGKMQQIGHLIPEEMPDETYTVLRAFLLDKA
jgi:hypothetical protein